MKVQTLVSEKWEIIPLEKQKVFKSIYYGVLALVALALSMYLEQFGLPEQLKFLAPFVPATVNFLEKFASERTYVVKK